jgi:glycerate-2-kinase
MQKIKNFQELAKTALREAALQIAEAGLRAIDTQEVIKTKIRLEGQNLAIGNENFPLIPGGRILVVGAGKCSGEASHALEEILGDKISAGAIIDVKPVPRLRKIKAFHGTHPLPSKTNIKAAKKIVSLLSGLNENDLVIVLVSGGGSTLFCLPKDGKYEREAEIFQALTKAGATIQEINTARKHLSLARGGYLTTYAYPARVISLIFSDIAGGDIQFVASGPTVKDTTTVEHAINIFRHYNLLYMCKTRDCDFIETPKEDKYFEKVRNIVVVLNETALNVMAKKAEGLGLKAQIRKTNFSGEAREVAEKIVKELRDAPTKTALLYGGESTVTIHGKGKGGRNMELSLSALRFIQENELLLALASDGHDYSDFAGAICDKMTLEKATKLHLDIGQYLNENNSYPFFEKVGDYILTGDTGSNVSDLIIAIKAG